MDEFARTQMGHRFFEGTMPRLVREITRLNDLIERLVLALERGGGGQPATKPGPGGRP